MTPSVSLRIDVRRGLLMAACGLFAVAIAPLPVVAQIVEEGVRQDNVDRLESARPILEYVIAGVCIFGTLAIGFKSSNRAQTT